MGRLQGPMQGGPVPFNIEGAAWVTSVQDKLLSLYFRKDYKPQSSNYMVVSDIVSHAVQSYSVDNLGMLAHKLVMEVTQELPGSWVLYGSERLATAVHVKSISAEVYPTGPIVSPRISPRPSRFTYEDLGRQSPVGVRFVAYYDQGFPSGKYTLQAFWGASVDADGTRFVEMLYDNAPDLKKNDLPESWAFDTHDPPSWQVFLAPSSLVPVGLFELLGCPTASRQRQRGGRGLRRLLPFRLFRERMATLYPGGSTPEPVDGRGGQEACVPSAPSQYQFG